MAYLGAIYLASWTQASNRKQKPAAYCIIAPKLKNFLQRLMQPSMEQEYKSKLAFTIRHDFSFTSRGKLEIVTKKEMGRSDVHQHPPRSSARRQDLKKSGVKIITTLYTATTRSRTATFAGRARVKKASL